MKQADGITVLSLFDGMSGAQIALERSGIKVRQYYASEVDIYAMRITQKNYPNTIQLGSVKDITVGCTFPKIDLLIGGSPCQGFSVAGLKNNFNDERSKLFWEYVRILRQARAINPDIKFILENVRMKQEWQDIISLEMGVQPIKINSALVTAQNRVRLYWTNIENVNQPDDKGIMLSSIIHESESSHVDRDKSVCLDSNYHKGGGAKVYLEKSRRQVVFERVKEYIVPFDITLQILDKEVARGKIGFFRKDSQANRVYYVHGKAVTLCGEAGGGSAKMGMYLMGCITPNRVNKRQNGQRFNDGQKFYTLTAQDQHGILIEGYIRKLTPVECERLQTVPDGYTEGVSNTQRYKMLGNGYSVDVICHLLKGVFNESPNQC